MNGWMFCIINFVRIIITGWIKRTSLIDLHFCFVSYNGSIQGHSVNYFAKKLYLHGTTREMLGMKRQTEELGETVGPAVKLSLQR